MLLEIMHFYFHIIFDWHLILFMKVFDFLIVNEILDLYVIDLTRVNQCNPETKRTGVYPINNDCDHPSLISIACYYFF